MRWVNEIPQVRSDREHAPEDQELMDLRPQMRLQLRSLKRQSTPVRTQPRPATTVTVRLMSLGVRPNTSEGVFPPTYGGQRKKRGRRLCHRVVGSGGYPIRGIIGLRLGHSTNLDVGWQVHSVLLIVPCFFQAATIDQPWHLDTWSYCLRYSRPFEGTIRSHTSPAHVEAVSPFYGPSCFSGFGKA
jgi:hypothetical protein